VRTAWARVRSGQPRRLRAAADALLEGKRPVTKEVRPLHAAARLAFDSSPGDYDDQGVGAIVIDHIGAARESGPRGRAEGAPNVGELEEHDEAVGRELLEAVRARRRAGPGGG
jgi:hypothetical protein